MDNNNALNMMDELAFLASFQRRSILGDISPSSLYMRGSHSHGNMSFSHELYTTATPEEQIIRQRSHRTPQFMSLKRQPFEAIENDTAFLQITPAKDPKFTQLSRKRLLMSPANATSTPKKEYTGKPAKRPRLSPKPTVPLQSELHAFSTSQLVTALDKLVNNHPELEQELRTNLPAPDLQPLEEKLAYLKRNILRSLPTVRFGSTRDAYCYRRAKLHLSDFKKACVEQGKLLVLSQAWEAVIRYVLTAWKYVNGLPTWDTEAHNATKQQCYQALAAQCMVGVRRGQLDREKYRIYRKKLEKASLHSAEIELCIHQIDKILDSML